MKKKKLSIVCQIFAIFFGIILFAGILAWIITSQISKIMEPENLVEMVTDNGVLRAYLPPMARFRTMPGTQVSIFGLDPSDPVTGTGLKFPVENLCLKRWWTAALNEAVADEVTLSFATSPLIVFTTHCKTTSVVVQS